MSATPEVLGVQCARCRAILRRIAGASCYGEFAQQSPSEGAARLWPDHYCFRDFVAGDATGNNLGGSE